MVLRPLRYIPIFLLALLAGSCNLSKWVPEGNYRLDENHIEVDGKKPPAEVRNIVKQQPTAQFSNWIYTIGNPTDSSGFAKWVSNRGEAPTIMRDQLSERTATQLGYYYFNRGYFNNEASYEVVIDSSKQAADVYYKVELGHQYTFGQLSYDIASPDIREMVLRDTANSMIVNGDPYDEAILEKERDRLSDKFRNDGFFGFSKSWIRYTADTVGRNGTVDIILRIIDRPVRLLDTTYSVPHQRYHIEKVYIDYNFNYLDPNASYLDTTRFNGYELLIRDEETYHPHLITRAVHFRPGDQFNAQETKESYTHLTSLGVFGATEIEFTPVEGTDSTVLNAFVKLSPLDKRSFTSELEGTNTSGNYGIAGNVGWINRNLFGAGEVLDLTLKGGIQAQVNTIDNSGLFNTTELGAEAGINFSRFLIPLSWQARFPKKYLPSTRIYTSYSQQSRVEFQRRIVKVGISYQARPWKNTTISFTPLDLSYVNLLDADPDYINSLFFKTGFQDNLIASNRLTFTYIPLNESQQLLRHYFRFSYEGSGNVLSLFNGMIPVNPESGQGELLGVPYAQYVKFDVEYRNYFRVTPKTVFVSRGVFGITYNYGNSPFLPPFEKNFLAGGSQDVRAWVAYRLGPGNMPNYIYDQENYAAVAPIKAMINLEYRFPIAGSLKGALFADAGNVWLFDRDYDLKDFEGLTESQVESAKFKWNRVIPSSALGTGFGLRYDFGFFQLRLDGGLKVWDPSEPAGYEYVLGGLRWENVTYNFALGYPF